MPLAYDLYHGFSIQILLNKNYFLILPTEAIETLSFLAKNNSTMGGQHFRRMGPSVHPSYRKQKNIFEEFAGSPGFRPYATLIEQRKRNYQAKNARPTVKMNFGGGSGFPGGSTEFY